MHIGIISYYKLNFKSSGDGLRENGNIKFLELLKAGKENNILFEKYVMKNHKKYDLILILNEPRIYLLFAVLLRNLLIKNINIFYMSEETPIGRKRLSLLIPIIYRKILINSIKSENLSKKNKYFLYTEANIPEKSKIKENKKFILKGNRKKLLCYVGGNILSLSNKGTYKFRNNLVRQLSKYEQFSLYGRGWNQAALPIDLPLIAIVNRIPFLKNSLKKYFFKKYPKIINKGIIKNKLDTINNYNFTLAIEPYIGEPQMLLEKIFDPMLSGSIPVYFGPRDIDIPEDIFIRIDKEVDPKELIIYLDSFKERELVEYRKKIYNYLISNKSNRFRYSSYTSQIIELIKKESY